MAASVNFSAACLNCFAWKSVFPSVLSLSLGEALNKKKFLALTGAQETLMLHITI